MELNYQIYIYFFLHYQYISYYFNVAYWSHFHLCLTLGRMFYCPIFGDGTIWHHHAKYDNLTPTMQGGQFDTADNLTPRTIWHHHKFYISTIVWPQNMIRNILIATIYLFDWKLSCIMSLYQIRARQGPHIKTYLISWQLFGPKISLEIHCWPITTFF